MPSSLPEHRRRPGVAAGLRASWGACPPLARDIAAVLVVKACVLGLLWAAFFRTPEAPRMTMEPQRVAERLLAPSPVPEATHGP